MNQTIVILEAADLVVVADHQVVEVGLDHKAIVAHHHPLFHLLMSQKGKRES